jgi:hypothetical protein
MTSNKIGCVNWRHGRCIAMEEGAPSGAVAAWLFCSILAAGFFSLGYMAGVWGWV